MIQHEFRKNFELDVPNGHLKEELLKVYERKIKEVISLLNLIHLALKINYYILNKKPVNFTFDSFIAEGYSPITPETMSFRFLKDKEMDINAGRAHYEDIRKLLYSSNYLSPSEMFETNNHLVVLYGSYLDCIINIDNGKLSLADMQLDISLARLSSPVLQQVNAVFDAHNYELPRIRTSSDAKKLKSNEKSDWVFNIYGKSSKIKSGMKLHTIAKVIAEEFKKLQKSESGPIPKHIKPPGVDQIKNYLKGNDKIIREFEQVGRYWFKKM